MRVRHRRRLRTGKTNEMCSLAEEFSASRVALFFSAGAIPASLSEVLIDDFNWHFSEQLRAPEIVRRLAEIATKTGQSVLIFVDALDEAPMQAFAQSISEFALHLSSLAAAFSSSSASSPPSGVALRSFEGHRRLWPRPSTGPGWRRTRRTANLSLSF